MRLACVSVCSQVREEMCLRVRADAFGVSICSQVKRGDVFACESRCVCVCIREEMCLRVRADDIVLTCVRSDDNVFACVSEEQMRWRVCLSAVKSREEMCLRMRADAFVCVCVSKRRCVGL